MRQHKGIILLGPTGSGKTPLGNALQQNGLWGCRCHHFDFGKALREMARAVTKPSSLGRQAMDIIHRSLSTGTLLKDQDFHVAQAILTVYIESRDIQEDDFIILNGLPRHVGQAGDIRQTFDVRGVIFLECPDGVVRQRIKLDSGGDRKHRTDDSPEEISRKIDLFRERTLPLLEYYRALRLPVIEIPVCTTTTPESILIQLNQNGSRF